MPYISEYISVRNRIIGCLSLTCLILPFLPLFAATLNNKFGFYASIFVTLLLGTYTLVSWITRVRFKNWEYFNRELPIILRNSCYFAKRVRL